MSILIISKSKEMMKKSFKKTLYRFAEIPELKLNKNFGIYIHVPFCYTKCSFCPFYKEVYSEKLKQQYLSSILKEIKEKEIHGKSKWVYFGGGTPNTLKIDELNTILDELRCKVELSSIGIELLPSFLTDDYLIGLKGIGFTKISIGVESFSGNVISKTGRKNVNQSKIRKIIEYTKSLSLWANVDMMVGLPNQDSGIFLDDIKKIAAILPDQITIYPFMIIRGIKAKPGISSNEQFVLIEKASKMLKEYGYFRKGVWTFATGDDIYDSSRDELTEDYIGFGPSAFSTYGDWKVVNPELKAYIKDFKNNKRLGFIAPKTDASDEWRKFARMIYDLKCDNYKELPFYIKFFIWVLKLTGYSKDGFLTEKGKIFAHDITKTVVESLPFPIQNPNCVKNYNEYISYKTVK